MLKRVTLTGAALLAIAMVLSCTSKKNGNPNGPTDTPSGDTVTPLVFSASPLDPSGITDIVPLGNLNPPGHTLPTNHIYFFHTPISLPVTAPAGGTITEVRRQTDDSLFVKSTSRTSYYFFHLLLDPGAAVGGTITAGQRVGVTVASAGAMDLGVTNDDVTLFFVRPDRYTVLTLHTDSPLKYFTEAIRNQLLPKVKRNGNDKDSKINFDQAGRLAGNWFLEGLAAADTENVDNGPKHLSFARDVLEPDMTRISIGGTITTAGAFFVQDGAPDPASVSTTTGRVAYVLYPSSARNTSSNRVLVVQMTADDRIRIEVFPPGTALAQDFTGDAGVYTR